MTTNDKKITLRNNKVAAVIAVYNDRRAKVKQWAIVSKYAANPDGSLSPLGHDAARCGASCEADALQAAEAFLANPAASGYSWLMPESNTEAAQQCAAEMEQADEPMPMTAIVSRGIERNDKVIIPAGYAGYLIKTHPATFSDGAASSYRFEVQFYNLPGYASRRLCVTADEFEYTDRKTSQPDMFAARVDDLPLFSGTAPRATVKPFVETEPQPTTPRLF